MCGAACVCADDPALPSGRSLTAFHGTDIELARTLLQGESLNIEKAAVHKIDGPPGFFLATEIDDAMFFAFRRAPGGVLACHLSLYAVAAPGGWHATPADSAWQDYPVHG